MQKQHDQRDLNEHLAGRCFIKLETPIRDKQGLFFALK